MFCIISLMHAKIKARHREIDGHIVNSSAKQFLVVCNGYKVNFDDLSPKGAIKILVENGYGIFNFNPNPSARGMDIKRQVEEIIDVVEHFAQPDRKIYLAGTSLGALTASIAAIKCPQINGIITLNGFFGKRKLYGSLLTAFISFRSLVAMQPKYNRIWRFYKQYFKPQHIAQPTLVIHSVADSRVSVEQSVNFFKQLVAQKDFVMLKTSDHDYTIGNENKIIAKQIDIWIKKVKK